jgi:hypothetical protein
MTNFNPSVFGDAPISFIWNVVRGDTASIKVEFLENDEATTFDNSGWTYTASTYDYRGDVIDELEVTPGEGYVTITATPDLTSAWGEGYGSMVAELAFDLEIVINGGTRIWTPIIGTINVIGDISTGSL